MGHRRLCLSGQPVRHNLYGVKGDGLAIGQPTLSAYFANLVFERNVLAGAATITAVPGSASIPSTAGAGSSGPIAACRTPLACPAVGPFSHER